MRQVKFKWKSGKVRLFLESVKRLTYFIGGIRSSKTFSGAVKIIQDALQYPGMKAITGAPTYRMLTDATTPEYFKILALYGFVVNRDFDYSKSEKTLILGNGSKILFRSLRDPDTVEGIGIDRWHIDEGAKLPSAKAQGILIDRGSAPNVTEYCQGIHTTSLFPPSLR